MNSPTSPKGLFSVINLLMLFLSGKANDVFLSFNHQEIGKNFADHLYKDLNYAGIRTLRDDGGIYTGQKSDIKRAIQESRISVVVFSKDYASSTKCLDQLVLIMDARRTTGLLVLPLFYNVDPSEVWEQKGLFEEAFAKHEKSFHKEMARVDSWRAALKEAADLKGKERKQDRYESKFIESIVKEIADKLNLSLPHVPPSSLPLSSALRPPSYFLGLLRERRLDDLYCPAMVSAGLSLHIDL
ncbi:TMV resistance protein N-like isoform X2 [Populus alba x Populus x berolinensis]|uniref:TMV resistance protein N-like isoform X2 n=1 Tax=Populus alba x Populus x berolinensis TaxID=444605 RepID=A0AAD6QT82_9ROSI|nr:TMV resistance protein N-like isoform X2 [Populus alba x Populus x berolinensis]